MITKIVIYVSERNVITVILFVMSAKGLISTHAAGIVNFLSGLSIKDRARYLSPYDFKEPHGTIVRVDIPLLYGNSDRLVDEFNSNPLVDLSRLKCWSVNGKKFHDSDVIINSSVWTWS